MGPFVPPRRLRTARCGTKYLVYRERIPLPRKVYTKSIELFEHHGSITIGGRQARAAKVLGAGFYMHFSCVLLLVLLVVCDTFSLSLSMALKGPVKLVYFNLRGALLSPSPPRLLPVSRLQERVSLVHASALGHCTDYHHHVTTTDGFTPLRMLTQGARSCRG